MNVLLSHERWFACALTCAALTFSFFGCSTPDKKKQSLIALANEYARDGLLREAAETYQRALKQNPKNVTARRNLGVVQVKSGAYAAAVKNLEAIIGSFDTDFEANFYLAEGYRAIERYAEAIYRYQKALRIKPGSNKAKKPLAWSYYKIRYYKEALDIAGKMYKKNPHDGQIAIILARTLHKLRKPKSALKVIRKAKARSPEQAKPYFESVEGDVLVTLNKCSEALKAYQSALKVQPLLAGALMGLGDCLLRIGKKEKAITYLERAIRIRPKLHHAYFLLGKAYEVLDKVKALRYYAHFRKSAGGDPEFFSQVAQTRDKMAMLEKSPKIKKRRLKKKRASSK